MTSNRFSATVILRTPGVYARTRAKTTWISWILLAILMLTALAGLVPNFARTRVTPAPNACINHLRQIDGAKQQWALENRKSDSDVPTLADILPYLAGWALLTESGWGRPLLLVLGILNLFNIPIGTALGIYTLWAWLSDASDSPPRIPGLDPNVQAGTGKQAEYLVADCTM